MALYSGGWRWPVPVAPAWQVTLWWGCFPFSVSPLSHFHSLFLSSCLWHPEAFQRPNFTSTPMSSLDRIYLPLSFSLETVFCLMRMGTNATKVSSGVFSASLSLESWGASRASRIWSTRTGVFVFLLHLPCCCVSIALWTSRQTEALSCRKVLTHHRQSPTAQGWERKGLFLLDHVCWLYRDTGVNLKQDRSCPSE